jgi:hypothetical protein
MQVAVRAAIVGLLAIAAYLIYAVVFAIASGEGHGSVFWTSIGVLVALALAATWFAGRLYRRRFANRNAKPS